MSMSKYDINFSFFCSEWEWNEGRPRCDKQCSDCKKTQNLNLNLYIKKERYALYEKTPRHGKDKNG